MSDEEALGPKGPPLSAWIIQQQPIQSQYTQTFVAMVNDTFKQQIITRIAVIGAGPSGLAAAKALLDEGTFQKIVVFERNAEIGGTWIYSPEVNPQPPIPSVDVLEVDPPESKNIILSPIYDALHTNLPHPVMAYRDFPFPKDTPLFPSHDLVLAYLRLFAKHFQLETMIRFHSCVTRAERLSGGWVLSIEDATHRYVETFDAVIVATGHYSIPHIPDIEGLKETNIEIMHSREYRRADTFRDKTVCVVGAGSSGVDIVRETSKTARKVYHSVRNRLDPSSVQQARSDNLIEIGSIRSVRLNRIESDDGVFNVDVLIFATGYLYSFPFLPFQKDMLIAKDRLKLRNLYREIFFIEDPTLAFLCLTMRIVPFPMSQIQSTVIARCWNGKAKLPSKAEMHRENEEDPHLINSDSMTFVLPRERESRYMDTLCRWAEDAGTSDCWKASNPLTEPISDWWREMRSKSPSLRLLHLGY